MKVTSTYTIWHNWSHFCSLKVSRGSIELVRHNTYSEGAGLQPVLVLNLNATLVKALKECKRTHCAIASSKRARVFHRVGNTSCEKPQPAQLPDATRARWDKPALQHHLLPERYSTRQPPSPKVSNGGTHLLGRPNKVYLRTADQSFLSSMKLRGHKQKKTHTNAKRCRVSSSVTPSLLKGKGEEAQEKLELLPDTQ